MNDSFRIILDKRFPFFPKGKLSEPVVIIRNSLASKCRHFTDITPAEKL
jgi:hypothetical protein